MIIGNAVSFCFPFYTIFLLHVGCSSFRFYETMPLSDMEAKSSDFCLFAKGFVVLVFLLILSTLNHEVIDKIKPNVFFNYI